MSFSICLVEFISYKLRKDCKLVFLPPYSPDYNPIELAFSALKAHIRRSRDEFKDALGQKASDDTAYKLLFKTMKLVVTEQKAESWYRCCGYVPDGEGGAEDRKRG